jgi:hypothetical protein
MKINLRLFTTIAAFLIVGYFGYHRRFHAEALVWHWKHGYWTSVGGYKVPVPRGWLVQAHDDSSVISLVDTKPLARPYSIPLAEPVIAIDSSYRSFPSLDQMKSQLRESLERMGVTNGEERTVSGENGIVVCEGGGLVGKVSQTPSTLISFQCISTDHFTLWFDGPQAAIPQFLEIASQIRRE